MKIYLNSRTTAKLNEIMSMINETSPAQVVNLMTGAFLESLKSAVVKQEARSH